jgi:hypothetical protein
MDPARETAQQINIEVRETETKTAGNEVGEVDEPLV